MVFSVPLSETAVDMFVKALGSTSRVLVLGGTGWFGRTALSMLKNLDIKIHIVASYQRQFVLDGANLLARAWDPTEVARFEPEVVLDFAYLTVNKALSLGLKEYKSVNGELAQQLFFAASLPSISKVLTVSSGASVRLPVAMRGDPSAAAYASGKQTIEKRLERIASERGISIGIARAWSVSGGHVQNPRGYALSGMISEGLEKGSVTVSADHRVYRRYCAAEELIALAIPDSVSDGLKKIDSGGDLVELRELARDVSACIPGSRVYWSKDLAESSLVDSYYSDGFTWDRESQRRSLRTLSLQEQIQNVVISLRKT